MTTEPHATSLILPVFPLKNSVIFPHMVMPVTAGRARSVAAVEAALATEDKRIAVFTQRDATVEEPGADDLYPVGTLCVIKRMQRSQGTINLVLQAGRRIERELLTSESPFLECQSAYLAEPGDTGSELEALHRTMLDQAARMLELGPAQMQIDLKQLVSDLEKPIEQAYVLSSVISISIDKQYQLLAANSQLEALRLIVDFLKHEIQVLEIQQQISSAVTAKMSKEQREMMLRQQLREIQDQLGESSPEQAEVAGLRERLDGAELPEAVRKEIDKELSRLERMPASSPDYQTMRSYIDLVLDLPWTKRTEDKLDLEQAREVLDEDHYDLEEVKDRIIEHLAVLKLNRDARAPILCFVGPPGVGKTSLGQSIARALGRKFERMSLGGLHDEAELRGHRRTYIGAMPGRIIQRHAPRRRQQPGAHAGRGGQAGRGLPRRPGLRSAGDPRPGAEQRLLATTTSTALRPVRGVLHDHCQHARHHPPRRCWTAWRCCGCPATARWRSCISRAYHLGRDSSRTPA